MNWIINIIALGYIIYYIAIVKKDKISFKDYLNAYRIEKAAELLKQSDEKIYKIAEKDGYSNTDYFISKFGQLKEKTPLQYRKQFFT